MKDGRGLLGTVKSKATRAKVKEFIENNPDAIKKDACDAIGITYLTLRKHMNALGIK